MGRGREGRGFGGAYLPRSNRLADTVHSGFLDDGKLEAVLASCWRSKFTGRSGCDGLRSRPLLQAVIAASCHCRSLDGGALLLRQPCNLGIVGRISGFDGAVQFGPRLRVVCGQLRILKRAPRNIIALRTWIALYSVPSG